MKRPCPALKDVRIDWLDGENEGDPDRVQVEVKQADGSYKTVATRTSDLDHSANDWSKLSITQIAEQNPDDPQVPWT